MAYHNNAAFCYHAALPTPTITIYPIPIQPQALLFACIPPSDLAFTGPLIFADHLDHACTYLTTQSASYIPLLIPTLFRPCPNPSRTTSSRPRTHPSGYDMITAIHEARLRFNQLVEWARPGTGDADAVLAHFQVTVGRVIATMVKGRLSVDTRWESPSLRGERRAVVEVLVVDSDSKSECEDANEGEVEKGEDELATGAVVAGDWCAAVQYEKDVDVEVVAVTGSHSDGDGAGDDAEECASSDGR